ncbi:M48 family metallopeptidase [Bacteroidales bacterium OttesenSCG-928-M11]|nr:M48 family metallopeptidase [Bacteroidales bacterium OttesenSCG-928-M11]
MRLTKKLVEDKDLGEILFRRSEKAKNYIIKVKENRVIVVVPKQGSYLIAKVFLFKNKAKVIEALKKESVKVASPYDEKALRKQAKAYLPGKIAHLAETHGFEYASLSVRGSRTRWGSCSSKKSINLSFFLMILPEHLIEYVILHELCHTVEMNHSPAFWSLLDSHLKRDSRELRRELKNYIISPKV